jgi:hypothetical protein
MAMNLIGELPLAFSNVTRDVTPQQKSSRSGSGIVNCYRRSINGDITFRRKVTLTLTLTLTSYCYG